MKYIRTKDIDCLVTTGDQKELIKDNYIVKQADTIEELCDGILVEEIGNESNWFVMGIDDFKNEDKEELKYLMKSWRYNFFIKNDRGLIYVAKLNDKGEPESI